MAQFIRPVADQATGGWSTTPLWSKVDDPITSLDGVEITSDDNTSPDNADLEGTNTGIDDPSSSDSHILRANWHKDNRAGHRIDAALQIWQGIPDVGTEIAELASIDIGDTAQTDSYTLSGAEADSITDYNDLYFRIRRLGDTGGNPNGRRSLVVDAVEFEVPDAAVGGGTVSATLQDSFTFSETQDRDLRLGRAQNDLFVLAEQALSTIHMVRSASDSLTLTLSLDRHAENIRGLTTALTFADQTVRDVAASRLLQEVLALTEVLDASVDSGVGGEIVSRELQDAINLLEQVVRSVVVTRAQTDSFAFAEALDSSFWRSRTLSDALTFAENQQRYTTLNRDIAAAFSFAENVDASVTGADEEASTELSLEEIRALIRRRWWRPYMGTDPDDWPAHGLWPSIRK